MGFLSVALFSNLNFLVSVSRAFLEDLPIENMIRSTEVLTPRTKFKSLKVNICWSLLPRALNYEIRDGLSSVVTRNHS